MEMTAHNSDRIIGWLQHEPSDAYIKQEFVRGFEHDKVRLVSNDTKMTCPHCFLIPRIHLVLKCGHFSCHRCFPEWFKRSHEPKCNYCRAPVVLADVMTLHDDRLKRPGSLAAKMYELAMITCITSDPLKNSTSIKSTITSSSPVLSELLSVRLSSVSIKTILTGCTSMHSSALSKPSTVRCAMVITAPKCLHITARQGYNAIWLNR